MKQILKEIRDLVIERSQDTTVEYFMNKNFKYYDLNNTQSLKSIQFKKALKRVGINLPPQKCEEIIDFYIEDNDQVDYKRFIKDVIHNTTENPNLNNKLIYSSDEYIHALGILEKEMNKKNLLYHLMPLFLNKDHDFRKEINFQDFTDCIKKSDFDYNKMKNYLKIIFDCLDKNLNGRIKYFDFLLLIVRDLTEPRLKMTQQLFQTLQKNRKLNLIAFKTSYKITNHPDCIKGLKNEMEIDKEMIKCLDIFEKFKNIKRFDEKDFNEFIQFLTSSIDMDRYFKFFIEKFFGIKLYDVNLEESTYSYLSRAETESKLERLTQKYSNNISIVADNSIDNLKNNLLNQGLLSIFLFLKQIYGSENNFKDELSLKNFKNIIKIARISISETDVLNIFKFFQQDNYNEFMTVTKLHKSIIGSLNVKRKQIIKDQFRYLDYKKVGKLYLQELRELFKPRTEDINQNQISSKLYDPVFFNACLNGYIDFMRINKDFLIEKQFLDFYRYISLFFQKEEDFEQYVDNTWKKFYSESKYEDFQKGDSIISKAPYGLYKENVGHSFIGKDLNKKKISLNLVNQGAFAGRCTDRSLNLSSKRSYNRRKTDIYESEKLNEEFRSNFLKKKSSNSFQNINIDDLFDNLRKKKLLSIFELVSSFKKCDYNKDYFLEVKDFSYIISKKYPVLFTKEKINLIVQQFIDKNRINYQEFIESLKIPLNPVRKNLLKKLFKALDIFNINYVLFNVFKSSFNSNKHPLVLNGKAPEYIVYQDFFDSLFMFCKIYGVNLKKDIYEINLEQFIEFFDFYNMEIKLDEDFEQFVYGCFAQKMKKLK